MRFFKNEMNGKDKLVKFRVYFLFFIFVSFFIFLINIDFVISNSPTIGVTPVEKIVEKSEIDPETGLPKKLSDFQQKADEFKNREQNNSFLLQKWTILLANNKFFGPVLFYTEKFFSIFNPLWKAVFKIPFSWSWTFILSFGILIIFIILIYYLSRGLLQNKFVDFIFSVITAFLIGVAGTISKIVDFLNLFITNLIFLIILLFVIIILVILYVHVMKQFIKKSKEMELEMAKENIIASGKIAKKELEEMGGGVG